MHTELNSTAYNLISLLGPTASGKTSLATQLAFELNTCIISADSRQVYRGMDLGTGKDLAEYQINGTAIPYHLIDICNPGEKYNLFRYQEDFFNCFDQCTQTPIMCGGSGLYLEAILDNYNLRDVPANPELRTRLEPKSMDELSLILQNHRKLHNKTDLDNKKRTIRAIEIEEYLKTHQQHLVHTHHTAIQSVNFGIDISREQRRANISLRLQERLNQGMLQEVEQLAKTISKEDLLYYGLEYKYLGLHLYGELSYEEMFDRLEIEIHKFAKRQMTFFRKMQRKGIDIHWLDYNWSLSQKLGYILNILGQHEGL